MTLDQYYGLVARAPLDGDERKARATNRLVRESAMEQAVRMIPESPDDDD